MERRGVLVTLSVAEVFFGGVHAQGMAVDAFRIVESGPYRPSGGDEQIAEGSNILPGALKASRGFNQLPTPVKSYVLSLGVEQGLQNPADVSFDDAYSFEIPVPSSDLNLDGKKDYYAAACMFSPAEFESIYQTNGYPCSYGVLILSSPGGGYQQLDTLGMLIGSKAGTIPTVLIAQRNFGECGGNTYMCEAEYIVGEDGGDYVLNLKSAVASTN